MAEDSINEIMEKWMKLIKSTQKVSIFQCIILNSNAFNTLYDLP